MTATAHTALEWSPRVLGILTALFLGIFALDAFGEGRGFLASLPGFLVHLLPTFIVLAVVALAWRRAWLGALAFAILAALYAVSTRRIDWFLVIGVPLLVVSALYLASWRWRAGGAPGAP